MNSLNSILLEGNLTRDPELRTTPKGTPVCSFSVASNRFFRQNEETIWRDLHHAHRISLRPGDVALVVSKNGKQLLWYEADALGWTSQRPEQTILRSTRWRIGGRGTWNPLLVQWYAEKIGLELIGIKLLVEIVPDRRRGVQNRLQRAASR